MTDEKKIIPLKTIGKYGPQYHWHPWQSKVMESKARFIGMFAGSGGGKTCSGPPWLKREIDLRGPGDYICGTSTFPLMKFRMIPEFLWLFREQLDLGTWHETQKYFEYHDGKTKVFFFSAKNPESIESVHAKAAWLDEVGQIGFRQQTWDAVQRRLGEHEGRILMTTTLYALGWLRNEIYLPWTQGDKDIEVVQFPSTANPNYSIKEFERQRKRLPDWKFKMFYLGEFAKPAGLIYDNFDTKTCVIPRFKLPTEWPRYVGVDFGRKNTAALWRALNPYTGERFVYREYLQEGQYAEKHVNNWKKLSQGEFILKSAGGSHQEDGWREAFTRAGWTIIEPTENSVEVGIDIVTALHGENKIFVFDDLKGYIDDKESYSWKLNSDYEPMYGKIEDKADFHWMDCERYIEAVISMSNTGLRNSIARSTSFV